VRVFLLLSVLILSACASKQPTYYYALKPIMATPAKAKPSADSAVTMGIGPLSFPEWLNQTGVVTYKSNNELNIPYYRVWAGDLAPMIVNVVAANISSLNGWPRVFPFPWDNRHRPVYQVRLHIEEFAGSLNREARLHVKWTLLDEQGRNELFSHVEYMSLPVKSALYRDYVGALNQLLNDLSQKIAKDTADYIEREKSKGVAPAS